MSELTRAREGAELPALRALLFRPDGLGWTAIYSPSISGSEPPRPRGLLSLASLRSEGARFDPEQIRESLHDMHDAMFRPTTTSGT